MPPVEDHERFMRLLLTHELEILRSVLVFVPHRPDARDIMQETAVALWSHFDEYDPSRPFVNWAHGFARNEVRRFLRARQRRQALTERAAAALMATADAREGTRVERERHLTDCLQRLPEEQRRLVDGYYFRDRSVETLAREHRRTVEAIYKALQRIRSTLRQCIERKVAEAGT
jgi:RNA polymerase sigma-70 factor (ECF subfamily)